MEQDAAAPFVLALPDGRDTIFAVRFANRMLGNFPAARSGVLS
jgi:hypothetical protein